MSGKFKQCELEDFPNSSHGHNLKKISFSVPTATPGHHLHRVLIELIDQVPSHSAARGLPGTNGVFRQVFV